MTVFEKIQAELNGVNPAWMAFLTGLIRKGSQKMMNR